MTTDLLTIDPVSLILGAGIWCAVLYSARPWHKPEQWHEAPAELRALVWSSLFVSLVEFVVLGAVPELRDRLNPYLGRGPMFVYFVGASLGMTLCRRREPHARWVLVSAIGLWTVMGLWRYLARPERPGESDPSRMVSPYQLIWTVGIPLVWVCVLLSPRVKRYCSTVSAANEVRTCLR
jgi:hypothetical protein